LSGTKTYNEGHVNKIESYDVYNLSREYINEVLDEI